MRTIYIGLRRPGVTSKIFNTTGEAFSYFSKSFPTSILIEKKTTNNLSEWTYYVKEDNTLHMIKEKEDK